MNLRPPLRGQTCLVTGGAGFIGSHCVDRLLHEGAHHVVVIDNLFVGSERNLKNAMTSGSVTFYKDDIEHPGVLDYLLERHPIQTVFHCATKALNYSFIHPRNAFETNVTSTLVLLEALRKGSFQTLCHFSTSEVYGSAQYTPMDEAHPKKPTTTYAAGKAAADLAVESYVAMFDLDAYIIRPFNNYGPRQNHEGLLAGVIPRTLFRIVSGQHPEIHGSGQQSRDFIFVEDTVRAIFELYPLMPRGESVNIATDEHVSIRTVIEAIAQTVGYTGPIDERPARHSDVECHQGGTEKLQHLIDFKPTPFSEGLPRTVAWYQKFFGL